MPIKNPGTESTSLDKLRSELRRHSDARKKTDLAIKDIEKELKRSSISTSFRYRWLEKRGFTTAT